MSHDAAEENGEPLYETEPQTQYAPQEDRDRDRDQDQDQDLYQTPAETTAGGEALLLFVTVDVSDWWINSSGLMMEEIDQLIIPAVHLLTSSEIQSSQNRFQEYSLTLLSTKVKFKFTLSLLVQLVKLTQSETSVL